MLTASLAPAPVGGGGFGAGFRVKFGGSVGRMTKRSAD